MNARRGRAFGVCVGGSGRAANSGSLTPVLGILRLSAGLLLAAPQVEFLSERPELLVGQSQAWGVLGLDTAAHAPGKPGESLRIGAQTYPRGLGHHARGRLVVWLGGEFDTFEAEVGLQPCCGGGSATFRRLAGGDQPAPEDPSAPPVNYDLLIKLGHCNAPTG